MEPSLPAKFPLYNTPILSWFSILYVSPLSVGGVVGSSGVGFVGSVFPGSVLSPGVSGVSLSPGVGASSEAFTVCGVIVTFLSLSTTTFHLLFGSLYPSGTLVSFKK